MSVVFFFLSFIDFSEDTRVSKKSKQKAVNRDNKCGSDFYAFLFSMKLEPMQTASYPSKDRITKFIAILSTTIAPMILNQKRWSIPFDRVSFFNQTMQSVAVRCWLHPSDIWLGRSKNDIDVCIFVCIYIVFTPSSSYMTVWKLTNRLVYKLSISNASQTYEFHTNPFH